MLDGQTTIVVADTSGSMREHGKAMLVRNLLAHIRQSFPAPKQVTSPHALVLVVWNSEATILSLRADQDLPTLPLNGRATIQPLLVLLDELASETDRARILFLSDGHLPADDVNSFQAWLRRHPNCSVRAIAVGPDASTTTLSRLAGYTKGVDRQGLDGAAMGTKGWFAPEDIGSALESWPPTLPTERPMRIAEFANKLLGDN